MGYLKTINPLWYILISLVLFCIWGAIYDDFTENKVIVLLVQIGLAVIGSYGTYLKGELSIENSQKIKQDAFKKEVRERYRRLHGILNEIHRVYRTIEHLQKINRINSVTVSGLAEQLNMLIRILALCMKSWRDFAPSELEELHNELFGNIEES